MSAVAGTTPENLLPSRTQSVGDAARGWWVGVRNGELGSLPIVIGIVIIAIYFQSRNSHFLTAGNFVNLIAQASPVIVIGMGVVFVLLLGEIDLSIGYVSGIGGVVAATLLVPDGNGWSTAPALIAALEPVRPSGCFRGSGSRRSGCRASSSPSRACSRGTASCCRSSATRARSSSRTRSSTAWPTTT